MFEQMPFLNRNSKRLRTRTAHQMSIPDARRKHNKIEIEWIGVFASDFSCGDRRVQCLSFAIDHFFFIKFLVEICICK